MRQLIAIVPRGRGAAAIKAAQDNGGTWAGAFEGHDADGAREAVMVHVPNAKVEQVIGALQEIGELRISLSPRGVIELEPPQHKMPSQVTDVTPRSPLEIFFGGLQSIGSWKGFLGYAVASSIVVWLGLYTNTWFLLTASMLIAPFAGPAMNLALGTARGDVELIGRSVARYFASLAVSISVAALLSFVFSLSGVTDVMAQVSLVASHAALLPLTAGAAGALNLCQSERNSLVTAAGAGVLIAASLAPQAALFGMAIVLWKPDMVMSAAFVLLLQLVGINLSGALVFALFGLRPRGVRYARGRPWLRWTSLGLTAAAVAALLVWQNAEAPPLQRGSRAQAASQHVEEAITASGLAWPVDISARFTRADIPGQKETLLVDAYVQRRAAGGEQEVKRKLRDAVETRLKEEGFRATPLVNVTLLEP